MSAFFHPPKNFEALCKQVLPSVVLGASEKFPARAWVPLCSTGESAWSLAICLAEQFEAARKDARFRVFATDPDDRLLAIARRGLYPRSIQDSVSPQRLARFFERMGSSQYRLSDQLHRALLVGEHSLANDPPIFTGLDLIYWCSSLENLSPELAPKVLERLHLALKDQGWLVGHDISNFAETAALFERIGSEWPIYRKRSCVQLSGNYAPAPERQLRQRNLEEQLRGANRKVAWMAAEVQAANEELRASNVQLRSLNEELSVLNEELRYKVTALNAANNDLSNLIGASDIAVVFLDARLHIRRFTLPAARMFALEPQDSGRSLLEVASKFFEKRLVADAQRALETATLVEREIRSRDRWYLRRILPYPTIGGATSAAATWFDITQIKSLQEQVSTIAELEQRRIGQELHDGTRQELAGLGLLAQNLTETLSRKGETGDAKLAERLERGISEANAHVRSLARGLVPIPIDAKSLAPALADLARSTQEAFGISCIFELSGPVGLQDARVATHLYRIAQEAVRNAVSHANATRIAIRLRPAGAGLRLEVSDDGVGISPATSGHRGVGLQLMEHRCQLSGGSFLAARQEGGGTIVACTLGESVSKTRANS